ncbi:MAG TPA: Hsp20/alpha crystallin family protein [Bacillota bacterium]|jgi:HSP20 family protein|nr:Hsp20/alpha crystallin family protein [Bacillota bacterium]HOL16471.1 Hsp20/alpha crystallin family protein [Bacillota bacterium]
MPRIPYEPMRYIEGARREMERLFGASFFREEPRIDIYEKDSEVIASCEIPGLQSKEDIRIEIGDNMLTLGGTIKREHEVRDENVHRQERYWGSFRRSVALPAPVIAEESKASYRNGILEITMPKADPQPRRKNVEIEFH